MELTDVTLVGPLLGTPPRLQPDSSAAVVTVPEEAASSEVSLTAVVTVVTVSEEAASSEVCLNARYTFEYFDRKSP